MPYCVLSTSESSCWLIFARCRNSRSRYENREAAMVVIINISFLVASQFTATRQAVITPLVNRNRVRLLARLYRSLPVSTCITPLGYDPKLLLEDIPEDASL